MPARCSHRGGPLLPWPTPGAEMTVLFFSKSLLQQIGLHAKVRIQPFQSSVLLLRSLHLAHLLGVDPATLRPPFVKTGSADAMLPAQVGHGHATFRLAQHSHDLGFAKSPLLHRNLSEHLAEKILLLKPHIRGEDYHPGISMPSEFFTADYLTAPITKEKVDCSSRSPTIYPSEIIPRIAQTLAASSSVGLDGVDKRLFRDSII